jgi:CTP:molybdopterin cytidylyltransferase MocA
VNVGAFVSFSAVVPAAGRAERFGGGKLTADLRGEPLLDHTLRSLLESGAAAVIVVSGEADLTPATLLHAAGVRVVPNPDPSRGMFSSIQHGLHHAAGEVIVILPADMPFVSPATVRSVADECARRNAPIASSFEGRRGHPLAIPARLRAGLLTAPPTRSLKDALAAMQEEIGSLPVPDPGVLRDVDVRQDLGGPLT